MATNNSRVKFVYVGHGSSLPATPDTDTIYFLEDDKKLYVGSSLIAAFQQLSSGTPSTPTSGTVKPGGTLVAMNNTSVGGMTVSDVSKSWTFTTGTITSGDDGFATGGDVYTAIQAAVAGLAGAMHFLGFTSSAVTDGGQEPPTINHSVIPIADLKAGDVVIYQATGDPGMEYVWDTDGASGHWRKLGDDSSFVPKTRQVIAGTGLTGGGPLSSDITINHYTPGISGSAAGRTPVTNTGLEALYSVDVDAMGHVVNTNYEDKTNAVDARVTSGINTALGALDVSIAQGDYVLSVSQTDGLITANMGTKGTVAGADGRLVDGNTVYNAVTAAADGATAKWTVI